MKSKTNDSKQSNRIKTIAATVAALGAAIGVNMGNVLAGTSDLQKAELEKSAISSQKIKKPDVKGAKVERAITTKPDAIANKAIRQDLKTRPDVRADKSSTTAPKLP